MQRRGAVPPGLILSLAIVFGCASGVVREFRAGDALCASLLVLAAAALAPWRHGRVLLLAVSVLGAAAWGALARDHALTPPILQWFEARGGDAARLDRPVIVTGRLVADAAVRETGVTMLVDVAGVRDVHGEKQPATGRVVLAVAGDLAQAMVQAWTAGRTVEAPVLLRRPQVWLNPGGSSVRWQRLRSPFVLAGTIKSALLVDVVAGRWWEEAAAAVRRNVRRSVDASIGPLDARAAAITTAILIGDRAGLDPAVERRMQAAGTYHVIAISGGNVALVVGLCICAARIVVRTPRAPLLLALLAVLGYGVVVSDEPSVRRAVTAGAVYLAVAVVGLRPSPLHVVGVAAAGLALVDPLATIHAGAWLSFGATLGILLLVVPRISTPPAALRRLPRVARPMVLGVAGVVAATAAAELALLPISAGVFSRVGVAGLVLNLIAIPAMALVQVAGLFVVVAWPWSSAIAGVAAYGARLGATLLVESTRLLDVLPWLSWRAPPVSPAWTMAYYAAWAAVIGWSGRRRLVALGVVVATGAVIGTGGAPAAGPAPGSLRVTFLDVGQGDAALVQFPGGRSLLVDAGGSGPGGDVGGRVIVPAVWALGVRRLDWLALTHADLDHVGGALAVLRDLRPREVWDAVPVPSNVGLQALHDEVRTRGLVWRQLLAGHHFEAGGATVDVMHPPAPEWERQRVRNDDSLVLRVRFGRVEILLTGDAAGEFESWWSGAAAETRSAGRLRVLKIAHHGSRTSSSPVFLDAYRPSLGVVSAGRGNLFGHPDSQVLGRFEDRRVDVFRTDRDGAIALETDGWRVDVRTASGRRVGIARLAARPP